ncbi:MAG: metallopeptidase TldD-related protein [Chloroflexota bacterium]
MTARQMGALMPFLHDVFSEAKRKADEAEVFSVWSEETPVRFEANRLKEVQGREGSLVALRLIKGGRIGFAVVSGLSEPGAVVDMALETVPFGSEAKFEFPSSRECPAVPVFDQGVVDTAAGEMAGMCEALIARVREHTPDVLCDATVSKAFARVHILNSRGGEVCYDKTVFTLGLDGVVVRGEDMLFVGDTETSCRPPGSASRVADVTMWQLEMSRNGARVSSGSMPVILTPRAVAACLAMPLAMGFNGRTVLEGASPLRGRLGERLFDTKLNLMDEATTPFRPESRPCDDEGVPSQSTVLVEDGVVAGFLYDLQTAGLAGARSTGSGSRSRGGMPGPGVSCLVFNEGEATFEQMVAEMGEGLVVEQLMGAEQGNLLGGDFSGNVLLGFKVEKGRVVGRVKDVMVSGNVYQALGSIVAMGRESRWVYGMVRSPHIWLKELSVAAKA